MLRTFRWAVAVAVLAAGTARPASAAPYRIKTVKAEPPKELKEPVRKLLGDQSVQLLDAKGKTVCQVWFRKEVPAEEAKAGLAYRDLKETTLLGAIQYPAAATDYRKQKIKPGVYTLRLGFQPMDGDHMGVSTYTEFLLLVPARRDAKPDLLDPKALYERSSRSVGTTHPGVLMLFPNERPKDKPELVDKGNNTYVLNFREEAAAGGKKAPLGVGLTLVGSAEQ